jgi:hypothetical protein
MYVVGYNMPGYLPESEPHEYETFEEAREAMVYELEIHRDGYVEAGIETGWIMIDHLLVDLQWHTTGPSWDGSDGSYAFWIISETGE